MALRVADYSVVGLFVLHGEEEQGATLLPSIARVDDTVIDNSLEGRA